MNDSGKLGVLIAFVYFVSAPSLLGFISAINFELISVLLMYAVAATAFVIPIVLYVKGLRKAMKGYLITMFIPVLAVLLMFGSCLLMFNV